MHPVGAEHIEVSPVDAAIIIIRLISNDKRTVHTVRLVLPGVRVIQMGSLLACVHDISEGRAVRNRTLR
jgi:hypothetical protein